MFLCDPVTPTAGARKANKRFKIGRKSAGSSRSAAPSGQTEELKAKEKLSPKDPAELRACRNSTPALFSGIGGPYGGLGV